MILGEPASYDRFPGTTGHRPLRGLVLLYRRDQEPPHPFRADLLQKRGFGEPRLYDPFVDGPKSLLEPLASLSTIDSGGLREDLRDDPELRPDPGQHLGLPHPGRVRLQRLPADPAEHGAPRRASRNTPYKGLSPTYATHFFDFKGMVSTEYLTNYIENDGLATVIRDPVLDQPFVHFAVVPQKLSVDLYEPKDQYFCNFKMDVSLRRDETVIFQYSKEFPIYFPAVRDRARTARTASAWRTPSPSARGSTSWPSWSRIPWPRNSRSSSGRSTSPRRAARRPSTARSSATRSRTYPEDVLIPFKTLGRKLVVDPKMAFGSRRRDRRCVLRGRPPLRPLAERRSGDGGEGPEQGSGRQEVHPEAVRFRVPPGPIA